MLLLFVDARYQYLESARKVIAVMIYPFQRLTALPGERGRISVYFETQDQLLQNNAQLRQQHDLDAAQLAQMSAVQAENTQLRTCRICSNGRLPDADGGNRLCRARYFQAQAVRE